MVDYAHTIYQWYEFVGHGWLYFYRIKLWRNVWLYTYRVWNWKTWLTMRLPYMMDMSLKDMTDCTLIVYNYGEMFGCIHTVYELKRHGWLCTYYIGVIWVCRTWIVYTLFYKQRSFSTSASAFFSILPHLQLQRCLDRCLFSNLYIIHIFT